MKTIDDITKFLDSVVEEYTDILIDQTKILIVQEDEENFEACAVIRDYIDHLANNVATTISDMSGVPYENSYQRIKQTQKYIYDNLQATKNIEE